MKTIFTFLLLFIIGLGQSWAQDLNVIPTVTVRQLPDGWHKFSEQGATFDVQVLGGSFVKGNVKWFDGASYSGTFSGNRISGRGTYKWADGQRYEGSFKNNERHGKGSMIANDGSKWSGKWKGNLKNGKGKMYDTEGAVVQEGVWVEGDYVGTKSKKKK